MKKILPLLLLMISCRQAKMPEKKSPEDTALAEERLHLVVYSLEVSPADKYQAFISYINKEGKPDSLLTAKPWVYEFEAKPGTVLKAKVAARPNNPQERARGMVTFKAFVDGYTVSSGVGKDYSFEHIIE